MKPKSRLYTLVKNWSKKPSSVVKEAGNTKLYSSATQNLNEQVTNWARTQDLFFELALEAQTQLTEFVILNSLIDCQEEDVLRLFNDGIRASCYWHSYSKPTAIMIPMKYEWLINQDILKGLQNALLNCHLPIGLINVGLMNRPTADDKIKLQDSMIKLQRLGVLLHLMNFDGTTIDCELLNDHDFRYVYLAGALLRQAIPGSQCEEKLLTLMKIAKSYDCKVVAGPIKLIYEKLAAEKWGVDSYFGQHIMPAMTIHQVVKLGKSAKQQTAMRSHLNKKPS
jgi:EAL domain-containing protein (putative c-di-GMP-specific phosphodiesterase class I)